MTGLLLISSLLLTTALGLLFRKRGTQQNHLKKHIQMMRGGFCGEVTHHR